MLDKPAKFYREMDKYPSQIKIMFEDGHTEIYDRRIEQPAPQVIESIRIIKKWRGYTPLEVR